MSKATTLSKVQLVDQALKGLSKSVKYRVDADVVSFLSAQVKKLTVLTQPLPDNYSPEPLLAVIADGEVEFDDLSDISESLRKEVIRLWSFKLTRSNLQVAVSKEVGLSLDAIRLADKDVYNYVLSHLPSFITILTEEDVTISEQAKYEDSVAVLNDVVEEAPKELATVLDRAASGWRVGAIDNIDGKAWGELAKRSLFPATFQNVRLYRDQIGIDGSIAMLLIAAQRFEDRDQTEDEELEASVVALAQEVVLAKKVIPDPAKRVTLAESLNIKTYLEFPTPFEQGTLAGLMIESDLIEDSLETFQLLVSASADWETMEYAIAKSAKYKEFVTTTVLQPQVAHQVLESKSISDAVKRVVIGRSAEFLDPSSYKAQSALAREAERLSIPLSADKILTMATARVNADLVIPFLTPQLEELDISVLSSILTALGGDYSKMATRSYNRPKFRKGRHIEALVSQLIRLGTVSSVDDKGEYIRVNMRHP